MQIENKSDNKIDIKDLTYDDILKKVVSLGGKPYTAKQVYSWLYKKQVATIGDMTDISKVIREKLNVEFYIKRYEPTEVLKSVDGTRKYLFTLDDGVTVESVFIPEGVVEQDEDNEDNEDVGKVYNRRTICVSSQAGCALDCKFCLTGVGGAGRNLKLSEMVAQFEAVTRDIVESGNYDETSSDSKPITNVVMMGMGEPMHNYNEVVKFAHVITGREGYDLSVRKFTISTAGHVPGIEKLGYDTGVTLAVSLNATTDEVRDYIMPINKTYPIDVLLESLKNYPLGKKRKITIEYVLLKGVNDSEEDAHRLVKLLRSIPCKVNLIPFNKFPESEFEKPTGRTIQYFKDCLHKAGYIVTVRESKGADILAACGQLVSAEEK